MIIRTTIFLFILFTNLNFVCFSQNSNEIDSLQNELKQNKQDTTKIKTLIEIGNIFELANPDSAIYYFKKANNLAKQNFNKNKRFKQLQATALSYIGIENFNQSNYDSALFYFNKSLNILNQLIKIAEKENNKEDVTKRNRDVSLCLNNIGNVYREQGSYDKALNFYFKSLNITEEILSIALKSGNSDKIMEQKMSLSKCYNSIGTVHYFQSNFDNAIGYYKKAEKIFDDLILVSIINNDLNLKKYKRGIAACYNNIAMVISDKANIIKEKNKKNNLYNNAIDYYNKALEITIYLNDLKGTSKCYNNLGITYIEINNYSLALETLSKALKIKEEIGDKNGIATVWSNLALINNNLADSVKNNNLKRTSYYNQAVFYGTKAYELATQINSQFIINSSAAQLQRAFTKLGNKNEALKYAEIVILTKDSLFNDDKNRLITEMDTKYQSEKKQLEIEKLEKQKALDKETIARKEAETKKQKLIILFVVTGLIIVFAFSIILFKLFVDKKYANKIISAKNIALEQANEEISTQRDEIEAQRDIVLEQKQFIENIHEEVTSSIRYAKRIQGALMTAKDQLDEILGEHFIYFKPRDIVSGDFYWTTQITTRRHAPLLIVAVADCTGHGVPGAFMSMLGISYLNEIVRKEEVTNSADVLNHLRESVISSLKQKNNSKFNSSEQNVVDGMDISLCVLDAGTLKLQFSGANNPLYIIRSNSDLTTFQKLSNLEELKGNKMPIAVYLHMEPFTFQEIQLNKGDLIYLFSDGYADQFGGPSNKKFKYKALKELLLNNSQMPMCKQKEIIETTFNNWKGKNKQIDDVTIMGIKI